MLGFLYYPIFRPETADEAAFAICVPEAPRPNSPLAPLAFFFKAVAFESTASSNSEGGFSGGGGGVTVGVGFAGFGDFMHIINSHLVGRLQALFLALG